MEWLTVLIVVIGDAFGGASNLVLIGGLKEQKALEPV